MRGVRGPRSDKGRLVMCLWEENIIVMDGRRRPTSLARAMTSPRTSRMGGAPLLLAMNGRSYTVLHVHNESSASGQAAPEEEGPGSC